MDDKTIQDTIDNLPEDMKKQIAALAATAGMSYDQIINIVRSITPDVAKQMEQNPGKPLAVDLGGTPQIVRIGEKVGRNTKCPCKSGRKYKNCCLKEKG